MSRDSTSRQELARFLRSRRERITPSDVGLPAGPRRRTPGLRREEVAVLAGLSPTWYTYLEQGRDIRPSVEVLDSLAVVLDLTEDERRYMHLLAHGHVPNPRPLRGDIRGEESVRCLVHTTHDSPYPVYGVDLYCDLIAWNPATVEYYTDFARIDGSRPNMMRWMLTDAEAKARINDWRQDARNVVARWRAMTATWEDDRRLRELVTEFTRDSPEFGAWWEEHDVEAHRSRIRQFRHPTLGRQCMRLIIVQAAEFANRIVVFHVPVRVADCPVPQALSHRENTPLNPR